MTDSLLHFWGKIACFVYFPGNLCPQYVRQLTISTQVWLPPHPAPPLQPSTCWFLSRRTFPEMHLLLQKISLPKTFVLSLHDEPSNEWQVDQGNLMQTLVHSNVHVCTTTEYGYFSCVQCNYSIQYHQCDPMDLTYVLQQCVGCSALLQWPHMLALTGGHVALPMDRVDPKYQSRDNCSTCHFHAFHTVYI